MTVEDINLKYPNVRPATATNATSAPATLRAITIENQPVLRHGDVPLTIIYERRTIPAGR